MPALAPAFALVLVACGGGESGNTEARSSDLPPCSSVWTVGETLRDPYKGCSKDGQTVKPTWHKCDDGSRYAEWNPGNRKWGEAYAKEGGKIVNTLGEIAKICGERTVQEQGTDRTAALRKAGQGEPWADRITAAVETEPGRIQVDTNLVDPRGDDGSPPARMAIEICEAAVSLMKSQGVKEPRVNVMEKDGTHWVLHNHPSYPEPCTEI